MFLSNLSRLSVLSFLIFILLFLFFLPAPALAASFSLSPAAATQTVGNIFPVDIVLDTGSDSVSGATAILNYDTTRLQVQDDDPATAGVQIKQGTIFNQTPLTNTVDTVAGKIRYDSGSLGTSFVGHGTMATIHFKAIAAGTAAVTFVFDSSSTTNTSLVAAASGPTNLLTTVSDGSYVVATGSAAVVTPSPMQTLPTGATENTLMAVAGGAVLVLAGIYFGKKSFLN